MSRLSKVRPALPAMLAIRSLLFNVAFYANTVSAVLIEGSEPGIYSDMLAPEPSDS